MAVECSTTPVRAVARAVGPALRPGSHLPHGACIWATVLFSFIRLQDLWGSCPGPEYGTPKFDDVFFGKWMKGCS